MPLIPRRSFLHWVGTALAAGVARPVSAASHDDKKNKASDRPRALLRTEDFEAGLVTLESAESEPLADFLRDLHERRMHDFACHEGECGDDFLYLTRWIEAVTQELQARGHVAEI